MNVLESLLIVCAAALGGVLAGVASFLIGGMGGIRALNRRVTAVEDDVDKVDQRITREVKVRAGHATQEKRSERENMAEALSMIATTKPQPPSDRIGR